jgi:hypothetical protein
MLRGSCIKHLSNPTLHNPMSVEKLSLLKMLEKICATTIYKQLSQFSDIFYLLDFDLLGAKPQFF